MNLSINEHNYVEGKCMEMCPVEELNMREREKLLHVLEMVPDTKKSKVPKADKNRTVKCYSRSAAGKNMKDPNNLRPADVLLKTVSYLLFDVADVDYLPSYEVYDFIMDRLRSVRQDAAIQNLSLAENISILQPIVRFYAYSAYKLCSQPLANFDPFINKTHLQECLKLLLCLYDEYDRIHVEPGEFLIENRPQFEALYIIFNLGSVEPLVRFLGLQVEWKSNEVIQTAYEISVNYYRGNFVKTCRLFHYLPPLLAGVAALHLPVIRKKSLYIMATAYNSRNLCFPLNDLRTLLLYESMAQLTADCKHYGLKVDRNNVYFTKASFKNDIETVGTRYEYFVDNKLLDHTVQSLILTDS